MFVLGTGTTVTKLDVALELGNGQRREESETQDGKSLPCLAQAVRNTDSSSPAGEGSGGRREHCRENLSHLSRIPKPA